MSWDMSYVDAVVGTAAQYTANGDKMVWQSNLQCIWQCNNNAYDQIFKMYL